MACHFLLCSFLQTRVFNKVKSRSAHMKTHRVQEPDQKHQQLNHQAAVGAGGAAATVLATVAASSITTSS